jgi:hypothetical protein
MYLSAHANTAQEIAVAAHALACWPSLANTAVVVNMVDVINKTAQTRYTGIVIIGA